MSLSKQLREFRNRLKVMAQELGGDVTDFEHTGSGHIAFHLTRNNMSRKFYTPGSPSDSRWSKNAMREARKVLVNMTGD